MSTYGRLCILLMMVGIFEDADVQLKFSDITSAWVHEFGMMEQSESKLVSGVLTLEPFVIVLRILRHIIKLVLVFSSTN